MKRKVTLIVAILVICLLVIGFFTLGTPKNIGPCTEYKCDVKNIRLSTAIEISKDGEEFVKVNGNILKLVTDPLTMYDKQNNVAAYADDTYHVVSQDSHSIYVGDNKSIEMVGLVNFWGNTYEIYNAEGEKVARVTFDALNTHGQMIDMSGNLIADFNSKLIFKDFTVRIKEECNLDEKTVLMIFCSYYSDQSADSK